MKVLFLFLPHLLSCCSKREMNDISLRRNNCFSLSFESNESKEVKVLDDKETDADIETLVPSLSLSLSLLLLTLQGMVCCGMNESGITRDNLCSLLWHECLPLLCCPLLRIWDTGKTRHTHRGSWRQQHPHFPISLSLSHSLLKVISDGEWVPFSFLLSVEWERLVYQDPLPRAVSFILPFLFPWTD